MFLAQIRPLGTERERERETDLNERTVFYSLSIFPKTKVREEGMGEGDGQKNSFI